LKINLHTFLRYFAALRAENLTRYKTRETIGKSADFVSAITSTYLE
jgi:SAM-dependent MidA family methyltransferase